jgi:hypothetical protein
VTISRRRGCRARWTDYDVADTEHGGTPEAGSSSPRAGIVTPQFNPKFAVNTESEITRFHLCDQVDSAHDIRNAQPRATDLFLSSEEYRND